MKAPSSRLLRRTLPIGAAGLLVAALSACTGRGGGTLPPQPGFSDQASFGFSFSCQDAGGINPPTGSLKIQLDYTEHGTSLLGGPFSVHGIVDKVDPVLESELCIGKNPPPPPGNQLIFLGRIRPTSTPAPGQLSACPTQETLTTPLCRFEVVVQDNDKNNAPSKGDSFAIRLTSDPSLTSMLDPAKVFYSRAGTLSGGNITVN